MKLIITVLAGLLAFSLSAPSAQAKDKHKKHNNHHDDHGNNHRYHQQDTYPRSYGSQPYYYYQGRRHYSYERDPAADNRYYYPRPGITFSFGQ